METPKAILSDADGTLIDTLHLIRHGQYEAAKKYLTEHDIPAEDIPNYEAYEILLNQTVGSSARDTLERTVRLLYQNQQHHLETIDFDELHNLLNPIQDEIAPEFVKAYEGLSEFLSQLGKSAIKLAIFTSGTPHHIVRNFGIALPELGLQDLYKDTMLSGNEKLSVFEKAIIERYGLPAFTVVTCEDTSTHKPNPESINLAMERLGVSPTESIVFGDHKVDIQSGINAGISRRVGVTHGFDDRNVLEGAGATKVVDSLAELTAELAQ